MKKLLLKILLPLTVLFACLGFAACDKEPETLGAPQNVRVENGVICWDQVEFADGYTVYINDEEFSTQECSYPIKDFSEENIYTVEVQAFTDGGLCSRYCDMTYTGMYAVPTEGLGYRMLNDSYVVNRFAVDSNGSCVIPATYQGLPVTERASVANTPTEVLQSIKNLYLPRSLNRIIRNAFLDFCNLENIAVGAGNEVYSGEGNCLIDKQRNTLVTGCINSVIPDYVTKIGDGAYQGRNIESFVTPAQIIQIGGNAFSGCTRLKRAVLPDSLTAQADALNALYLTNVFVDCTALTEVNIPEGVQNLNGMFKGCTSLQSIVIPESATSLTSTFRGCTALKNVVISEGVSATLKTTFWGCTALQRIEVPASVKNLSGTFYGCTSLTDVILNEGLEILGKESTLGGPTYGAFGNCVSLSAISLPSTLKSIAWYAFHNCISLKSITIPDGVTKINYSSFENCKSLESVRFSKNIQGIVGHDAFAGCTSLKSVDIPENVTQLQGSVFNQCTSLKSIVLPKKLSSTYGSFENCPLEEVFYRGTEADWGENMGKLCKDDLAVFDAATKFYYSETEPVEQGNYWHYVDGVPTKWVYQG